MSGNSIGNKFTVTSFGESHGKHIGVVIDGCPANVTLDLDFIQSEMNRRRPGQSRLTTSRNESDLFEITSGVFEGKTTGAPICIIIPNSDQRSTDYEHLKDVYRPSHADFTYDQKYGIRDYRGGGRSSARVTAGWVAAGAIARQILNEKWSVDILAYVHQVHNIICPDQNNLTQELVEASTVRCPNPETSDSMIRAIELAQDEGDSLGGIVRCTVSNCPAGLGDPVFNKLNAQLAHAMFSINAVKGFQVGKGFDSVLYKGSTLNDVWTMDGETPQTTTNNSGGIQGGISNGMPIWFDVAFKPTATISKEQATINTSLEEVALSAHGRHDACVVPRAVPIVEAMAAIVVLDNLL